MGLACLLLNFVAIGVLIALLRAIEVAREQREGLEQSGKSLMQIESMMREIGASDAETDHDR